MKYDKTIGWAVFLTGAALCFLTFSAVRLATHPRWRSVEHVTRTMTSGEAWMWVPKHTKKLKYDPKKVYARTFVIVHTYDRQGLSYVTEIDTPFVITKEVVE